MIMCVRARCVLYLASVRVMRLCVVCVVPIVVCADDAVLFETNPGK